MLMSVTVRENPVVGEDQQVVEADHLETFVEEMQSELLPVEVRLDTRIPGDVERIQEDQELELVTAELRQHQSDRNEEVSLKQEQRVVILPSPSGLEILSIIQTPDPCQGRRLHQELVLLHPQILGDA